MTPDTDAGLTEAQLAAIEARFMKRRYSDWAPVRDLVAALRAAWADRDRYRAVLEHYADEANWSHWGDWEYRDWYVPVVTEGAAAVGRAGYSVARAALAPPDASGQEETR